MIEFGSSRCRYNAEAAAAPAWSIFFRVQSKQKLWHPDTGELLDQGMVVRFKAPLTFTGAVQDGSDHH